MRKSLVILSLTGLGALAVGGCQHGAAPAAKPAAGAHDTQVLEVSGKVVETADSGGYTFVKVDNAGKEIWAAIPKTTLQVGQQVALRSGYEMKNFASKGLGRTFDSIIFSEGIAAGGSDPHGMSKMMGMGGGAPDEVKAVSGKVTETMNAGQYTYALLEKEGTKSWVALPHTELKVGEEISCDAGTVMRNFTSKSLNKTFETVVFSPGITDPAAAKPSAAGTAAAKEEPAEVALSGKVVETMNSGGYTYTRLEKDGKSMWVAFPLTNVKVGDEVKFQPGMPMRNFTSKTLNRTFDTVYFSGGVEKGK